jgi:hypothetical protein
MRILKLAAAFAMTTGLVACSGDDGGISTVDAARIDAGMDALNLTGLGQLCNDNSPCPQNAPICLTFSDTATNGYCTPLCQDDWTAMSNAQGQIPREMLQLPASATQTCVDAFSGTPGTPACGLAVDIRPAPPIQPNMMYTIDYTCGISCGAGNTCPNGLVANTSLIMNVCLCTPP